MIEVVRLEMVRDRSVEYGKKCVSSPGDLAKIGFELLGRSDREMFLVVCLSSSNGVNAVHVVSVGSLTTSVVHPREVYKLAILTNSDAVAFIHNHPSGRTRPSKQDVSITRLLIDAGKLLGIRVLDHVIVGDETFLSFNEQELCDFEGGIKNGKA